MWYTGNVMYAEPGSGLRAETEAIRLVLASENSRAARRLVALGDSVTYGWGLHYALGYPSLLERRLNEEGAGAIAWRVINAGVPGDTVLCAERRYERDVSHWQADTLIIALGLNDAALRRTRVDRQRERLWLAQRDPRVRWGLRMERIVDSLSRKAAAAIAVRPASAEECQVEERRAEPRVCPELFTQALEHLVRRAQGEGLKVYLLSLPPLAWDRIAADQAAYYRRYDGLIGEVAGSGGVALIKAGDAPQMGQDTHYWQDDGVHPAADGQAWLAACIEARLGRDGFLG